MLDELLSRARRRMIWLSAASEATLALVIFLAALVLLVIVGTQILQWWIPLSIGILATGLALFRVFRAAPSGFDVARLLDQECHFSDTLSTALHFRYATSPVALAQRQRAAESARLVDLHTAIPATLPRSFYGFAALAVTAASLLLVRYGTTHRLELSAPIAHFNFDPLNLASRVDQQTKAKKEALARNDAKQQMEDLISRLGTSTPDSPEQQDTHTPGTAVTTGAREGKDGSMMATKAKGKKGGTAEEASESAGGAANPPKAGAEQSPSSQDGAPQSAQAGGKPSGSPESSSLLSKLKDAVSSLMSKMKPQSGQSAQSGQPSPQQAGNKQSSGQQSGQKQGQQDDKGAQAQQQGEESASADAEQMAPGQGAGKTSDQNASAKPGSGMGRQDGNKDLKDSEQMAAMGKLSEIIGKRSATITGDMRIEPQDGPQQLKTGYTHSTAHHGESGGDVSRDEVPVALQSYIQQYFEQVRKKAPQKTARAGKPESHQ